MAIQELRARELRPSLKLQIWNAQGESFVNLNMDHLQAASVTEDKQNGITYMRIIGDNGQRCFITIEAAARRTIVKPIPQV